MNVIYKTWPTKYEEKSDSYHGPCRRSAPSDALPCVLAVFFNHPPQYDVKLFHNNADDTINE